MEEFPQSEIGSQIEEYHIIDLYPTKKEFEEMTISSLVDKIQTTLDQVDECIIIGSSHGGLLALATQKVYPQKIKGLVLMAPAIYYYQILSDRYDISHWKEHGNLEFDFYRFEGMCELSYNYVQDLEKYKTWEDPKIPVLLIHGKKDDAVPLEHSRKYARKISDATELYPAEGVHHLGNVKKQLKGTIISWIEEKILKM